MTIDLKVLHGMIEPLSTLPYLRTTGFRTFAQCPFTWALQFLSPSHKKEDGPSAKIGTAAHAIIEGMLRELWEDKPADLIDQANNWKKIPNKEMPALGSYIADIMSLDIVSIIPNGIEYEFRLDIPGVGLPVKGTMDLIGLIDDNTILIVDHKTNRSLDSIEYWKADIQPLIYAMAARQLFPGKKVMYQLGYVNFENTHLRWETDPNEDQYVIDRLQTYWNRMVHYETTNSWPLSVNPHCIYCPIKNTCPEHERANMALIETLNEKFSGDNRGDRLEFVTSIIKVAETIKAELEEQIKIEAAKKPIIYNNVEYSVTTNNERKLDVYETVNRIFQWASSDPSPEERDYFSRNLSELLTAKVGGLDKYKKNVPSLHKLLESLVTVEQSSPRLKRRPIKPSEAVIDHRVISIAQKEKDFN